MPATVSTDDKPRRARKKAESRRWVREVQGIAALVVAGFGVVALATFDPRQVPAHQESLAGPVGLWLAWGLFQGFGYASLLFPILLGAWGASTFLRPSIVRGTLPLLGLAVLLVTATGLLSLAAPGDVVDHGGRRGLGADPRTARSARNGRGLAGAGGRAADGVAARHAGLVRGARSRPRRPAGAGAPPARVRTPRDAGRAGAGRRGAGAARARPGGAGAAARGRRALAPARWPPGEGPGLAGDLRLRQGRCRVVPASARRAPEGAAALGAEALPRGVAGQCRDPAPQTSRFRGRRPHRPGESGAHHHLLRVRAGARRQSQPGGQPRGRSRPGPEVGLRAHRGTHSRAGHHRRRGPERRGGDGVSARDLHVRGVRGVEGEAAAGPRQGRHGHPGGGGSHQHAAPARGGGHRAAASPSASTP